MNAYEQKSDETCQFMPKFDQQGLMPVITVDDLTGDVLMLAYMNQAALAKTLTLGEVHYWSRSRQELWHKGATSGHIQKVVSIAIDCDQDTLLLRVIQQGAACHTGRKNCFYRQIHIPKHVKLDKDIDNMNAQIQLMFTPEC